MKRLKRLWMTLLTVVLAVSMIIGGAGISAFAADFISGGATIISGDGTQLPQSVYLGQDIKVPGASKVTLPDGTVKNAPFANNKVAATMLGSYTVSYENGGAEYQYKIHCTLNKEYDFRVAEGGAAIPSVIGNTTEVTLPDAKLFVKNKTTSEFEECATSAYTVKKYVNTLENTSGKQIFAIGMHTIQYVATLTDAKKVFTKDFTVKSQANFKDEVNPTMGISGVPTEASLNTKVELPRATASDNFDTNVLVKITVTKDGKNVKAVNVNDYGYAVSLKTEDQLLDNVNNNFFYPTELGTYVVTYQGSDDAGNKSIKHTHNINVVDNTAPRLEKIEDTKIPARWAKSIKDSSGITTGDKTINFPFPEYSDNSGIENVTVSFTLTDTVNNKVVIKFADILEQGGNGSEYIYSAFNESNGVYDKANTIVPTIFDKDSGFKFSLTKYINSVDPSLVTSGKYTAVYQARDAKNNTSSKSYDITIEDSLEDTAAPEITLDTDEYIFVNDTYQEYTMPTAFISDAVDSRPTIVYSILDADNADALILEIENGEKIEIKDGSIKIAGKEDSEAKSFAGATLKIKVSATDDVGNSNFIEKTINLAKAVDFTVANANAKLSIDDSGLNFAGTANTKSRNFQAGEEANLGKFVFNSFSKDYRKYMGFEISLTSPDGELISGLSLETYVSYSDGKSEKETTGTGKIIVDKLSFTPSVKTENGKFYTLTVRAYDISGRSIVKSYNIMVGAGNNDGISGSSISIPTAGSVNVSYKLKNETAKLPLGSQPYIVRKISNAGKFSLLGINFTAYTVGKYTFVDGYYKAPAMTDTDFVTLGSVYNLRVSESSNPVFELLGVMPKYSEKSISTPADVAKWKVQLPKVIAFTESANAEIEITIKNPFGAVLSKDTEVKLNPATGGYAFDPKLDGEYTVTYTATLGSLPEVIQSYTIKVGDVVAPTFTVKDDDQSYAANISKNFEFSFKKLTFDTANNPNDALADVTFIKQLINPNGELVYAVSGEGQKGLDKQVKDDDNKYKMESTGLYTVRYTAKDKYNNTSEIQETIIVCIAVGQGNVSMNDWAYGQTAQNPVPVSSTNGTDKVSYVYEGIEGTVYAKSSVKPVNAGKYKVTATFAPTDNFYYNSVFASATFTIFKATRNSNVNVINWKEGENVNIPSIITGVDTMSDIICEFKLISAPDSAYTTSLPTKSGEYTVRITIAATENYESFSNTMNFTIEPSFKLSGGAIAGIVIASIIFLFICGFSMFWFIIKKKKS